MRLRQVALAAADLEATVGVLSRILGIAVAHHDPGVGVFGLRNAVLPLGDGGFLEIVTPMQPNTTVGRLLEKHGDRPCGYMIIFQTDDLAAERAQAEALGLAAVWEIDLGEAATFHLHPKTLGAVVSFDRMQTWGDWLWAGPDWRAHRGEGLVTGIAGATVAVPDPAAVAERWRGLVGRSCPVETQAGEGGFVELRLVASVPPAEFVARARAEGLEAVSDGFRLGALTLRFGAA